MLVEGRPHVGNGEATAPKLEVGAVTEYSVITAAFTHSGTCISHAQAVFLNSPPPLLPLTA